MCKPGRHGIACLFKLSRDGQHTAKRRYKKMPDVENSMIYGHMDRDWRCCKFATVNAVIAQVCSSGISGRCKVFSDNGSSSSSSSS
jgi:hypothetical protein